MLLGHLSENRRSLHFYIKETFSIVFKHCDNGKRKEESFLVSSTVLIKVNGLQ